MLPRRAADYRTLLWMLVLAPANVAVQYAVPSLIVYLWPVSFYLAVSSGVIAHNHMHVPTLRARWANDALSSLISVFYGYPIFAWLPTHNYNHHRLVNRPGDATITWRHTNRHNLLVAATYFFVSSYHQAEWVSAFIRRAKIEKPRLYRRIVAQYATTYGTHALMAGLAVAVHGVRYGAFVWALTLGLPAVFSLWTIMLFNYLQHVHADPWSAHNHSRNFDGRLLEFFLFGNGLHTIHHEKPGLHWSDARREHERIAHTIDPRLIERSMLWFLLRQYVLAPFAPPLGTQQIGRAPFDPPPDARVGDVAAEVPLVDAGGNAARA